MQTKTKLITFLQESILELSKQSGESKIDYFFTRRYRQLNILFPHKPFSVEQASFEFFDLTLQYLLNKRPLEEIPSSEYSQNYRCWIKSLQ